MTEKRNRIAFIFLVVLCICGVISFVNICLQIEKPSYNGEKTPTSDLPQINHEEERELNKNASANTQRA